MSRLFSTISSNLNPLPTSSYLGCIFFLSPFCVCVSMFHCWEIPYKFFNILHGKTVIEYNFIMMACQVLTINCTPTLHLHVCTHARART